MNDFDKQCLDLAIAEAQKTFDAGNYPVGAVLALDSKVIGVASDTGKTSKSYINHAEAILFQNKGYLLLDNGVPRGNIAVYSTLEPCLMCFGTAIMCKVNRVVYIQTDPHGGACNLETKGLGTRYQHLWPEVIKTAYSDRPKRLMVQFLKKQIDQGNRTEWSQKFLDQLLVS